MASKVFLLNGKKINKKYAADSKRDLANLILWILLKMIKLASVWFETACYILDHLQLNNCGDLDMLFLFMQ